MAILSVSQLLSNEQWSLVFYMSTVARTSYSPPFEYPHKTRGDIQISGGICKHDGQFG